MSQSSLETQFREAGIPIKQGVKIAHRENGDNSFRQAASNIWLYRWARNSYDNYSLIQRANGVRMLADSCAGIPSIIVGVGPSLDECWPALKAAAGRALIIATDAAFRPLLANGVRPDLVLSYDCKPEQQLLWNDIGHHGILGLFDSCAHPKAIASWQGPILFYNHFHQADELSQFILPHVFPSIGQIPSGATVGNTALLLSKILGCTPTLAVGMDFCYGYGDPYKKQGWLYRARDYRKEAGQWIPGEVKELYDNDERVSRSFDVKIKDSSFRMDPELKFYYDTFLGLVTHFKVDTINCSPDGALKDSVATMTLEVALNRFCATERRTVLFDALMTQLGPDPRFVETAIV
jgi:hypothetical protein